MTHAGVARPGDRLLEQRAADAAAAVAVGDHQAEVGDMAACLVRVPRDRQPPDDRAVLLGDEDGRVGMPPQRAQVATLLGDAAPAVRVQKPALGLTADRGGERGERRRILGLGRSDRATSLDDDSVPAAARVAGGRERAVRAPLDRGDAAEEEVAARPANGVPARPERAR